MKRASTEITCLAYGVGELPVSLRTDSSRMDTLSRRRLVVDEGLEKRLSLVFGIMRPCELSPDSLVFAKHAVELFGDVRSLSRRGILGCAIFGLRLHALNEDDAGGKYVYDGTQPNVASAAPPLVMWPHG
jgi:hypothetical protein